MLIFMSLSALDDSQWLSAATIALGTSVSERPTTSVILDPLANEHYQLLIGDLLKLEPAGDLDIFRLGPRWVLYVDVVGTIRSLFEREKFYLIELDDGTGCVSCTIWRQTDPVRVNQSVLSPENNPDSDYARVCHHLFAMARSQQPTLTHTNRASALQIGHSVQLRGRVKRFRGKLKVNAYFCRILSDPREELNELVHRDRLRREIYQEPYNPTEICEQLLKSRAFNGAQLTVTEARQILEEDGLHTFTKLDLCLNTRLADTLTANSNPEIFDQFDFETNWSLAGTHEAKDLKELVDELLKCLLNEGWIYPAREPIGGHVAYHSLTGDTKVEETVFTAIRTITDRTSAQGQGASIKAILAFVRQSKLGDWSRFSLAAMHRVLDKLEAESRIFKTQNSEYKAA